MYCTIKKNKTGGVPVGAEISHLHRYCTLNKRVRGPGYHTFKCNVQLKKKTKTKTGSAGRYGQVVTATNELYN